MIEQTNDLDTMLSQAIGHSLRFAEHKRYATVLQMIYHHCKKLPHDIFILNKERINILVSFEERLNTALCYERIE
ncbi:MAG: hypothetical protein ACSLEN_00305 [Candidatus Malihini olakiniferum]